MADVEFKIGGDAGELAAELKSIRSDISQLQSAITKGNGEMTKTFQNSANAAEKLNTNIDKTGKAIGGLSNNLKDTGTSTEKLNANADKVVSSFGKIVTAETKVIATQKLLEEQLKKTIQLEAEASVKYGENSQQANDYANEIERLTKEINEMQGPPEEVTKGFQSLKAQFKEARVEAERLQAQADEGLISQKVADEAARRASKIADEIGDMKARLDAFNPDRKFQAFSQVLQGVAGGFAGLQGAMGLFGDESEDVQKTLLKVQSALALSQGLNSVLELKDGFSNLKAVLGLTSVAAQGGATAFKGLRTALISTGIGALVVALGLLIANFDEIKKKIDDLLPDFSKFGGITQLIKAGALADFAIIKTFIVDVSKAMNEFFHGNFSKSADLITNAWSHAIAEGLKENKRVLDEGIAGVEAEKQAKKLQEIINNIDTEIAATANSNAEKLFKLKKQKGEAEIALLKIQKKEELEEEGKAGDEARKQLRDQQNELTKLVVEHNDELRKKELEARQKLEEELINLRKTFFDKTNDAELQSLDERQQIVREGNTKIAELEEAFFQLNRKLNDKLRAAKIGSLEAQLTQEEIDKAATSNVIAILKIQEETKRMLEAETGQTPIHFMPRIVPEVGAEDPNDGTKEVAATLIGRIEQQMRAAAKGQGFSIASILFPLEANEGDNAKIDASLKSLSQSLQTAYSSILQASMENVNQQITANQMIVQSLSDRIDAEEALLEKEEKRQEQGYAHSVDAKQKEVAALKAQRDKEIAHQQELLEKKKKIAREAAIADSIATSAKLILATAEAVESAVSQGGWVGVFVGLAAAASLVAGFLSIKKNLEAANTVSYGEGGELPKNPRSFGKLKGPAHTHGGIPIPGTNLVFEGEEYLNNKRSSKEYFHLLEGINKGGLSMDGYKDLRKLLNKNGITMSDEFIQSAVKNKQAVNSYALNFNNKASMNDTKLDAMNDTLKQIRDQNKAKEKVSYGNGTKTVESGSITRIIRQ